MRRRELLNGFVTVLNVLSWRSLARASEATLIGVFGPFADDLELLSDLLKGLEAAGLTEGKEVHVAPSVVRNELDLVRSADELISKGVAAIVVVGPAWVATGLARITSTIPLIVYSSADPVLLDLADSINHPGRNVTGTMTFQGNLDGKRLALLKIMAPKIETVCYFFGQLQTTKQRDYTEQTRVAALGIGKKLEPYDCSTRNMLLSAVERLRGRKAWGLLVGSFPVAVVEPFRHLNCS